MPKVPGLQDVPGPNALRPNECDPSRGPLDYANPLQTIGDFGSPQDPHRPWIRTSPAKADHLAKTPNDDVDGSGATIQPGIPMVRSIVAVLALAGLLSGCAHTLGYAGSHPGKVTCKGKGSITGTGAMNASAGIGGTGLNSFTLQADCGDGFTFEQGPPVIEPAPSK